MRAIIVGSGPAGVSAALYLARAGVSVTILSKDGGALLKADKIENYYGFAEPISGKELYEQGLANAKRLGCTIKEEEVIGVSFLNTLAVQTTEATYEAEAVILATGASRTAPKIDGLARLEGHGVSYCAICDAAKRGSPVSATTACRSSRFFPVSLSFIPALSQPAV